MKKKTKLFDKDGVPILTPEEIAAGVTIRRINNNPPVVKENIDISSRNVERMAQGFILGSQHIRRNREVKEILEEKVVKRIGSKGKYLTDKLFELIEGVYIVQKDNKETLRYYKVPPNLNAITYALDRVLGKPKQYSEVSEEKKGVIIIESIIRNLAGEEKNEREA